MNSDSVLVFNRWNKVGARLQDFTVALSNEQDYLTPIECKRSANPILQIKPPRQ